MSNIIKITMTVTECFEVSNEDYERAMSGDVEEISSIMVRRSAVPIVCWSAKDASLDEKAEAEDAWTRDNYPHYRYSGFLV